jgi:F-type H+-transporting ATPase subunit a
MFFSPLDQFELSLFEFPITLGFGIASILFLASPLVVGSLGALFGFGLGVPSLALASDEPGSDRIGFSPYLTGFSSVTYNGFRRQIPLEHQYFFPALGFLYVLVLVINLVNLFPGAIPQTSWLYGNLLFSLSVFFSACINLFSANGLKTFNLFLPSGAPSFLVPFIFLIEITSFLIRPFSMAIRLFANIVAGHILLHIVAGAVLFSIGFGFLLTPALVATFGLMVVFTLEILVAFLQAYVFFTLATMYMAESVSPIHH